MAGREFTGGVLLDVMPSDPRAGVRKDYADARAVPTGGTTGQALVKTSGADYAAAWAALASAGVTGYVPAGSTTPVITHSLGTTDVVAIVRDAASGLRVRVPDEAISSTQVRLTFTTAPTTNQYRYLVFTLPGSGLLDASSVATGRLDPNRLPLADTPTVVTYGATLTLDPTTGRSWATTLAGNCAVSMAAGAGDGQSVTFEAYGGAGGGQVSFTGAGLLSGLTSPFSVAASKVGLFGLRYSSRASRWVVTAAGMEQ